jgi:hypothetical protein
MNQKKKQSKLFISHKLLWRINLNIQENGKLELLSNMEKGNVSGLMEAFTKETGGITWLMGMVD